MNTIKIDNKNCKMVAHRGVSGLERENTLAAFIAAGNRSHYGIETDVHSTADGQFVCIHDCETGRVAGGDNIVIEKTTFEYVRKLKLTDFDGQKTREDLRIPTMVEYIRTCKRYEKIAVLELKTEYTYEQVCKIIDLIEAEEYLDSVVFISFSYNNLLLVKQYRPEQHCQWLTGSYSEDLPEKLQKDGLGLDIWYPALTEQAIKDLHAHGVEVNIWTCDDPAIAEKYVAWGVDYITSNILEGK